MKVFWRMLLSCPAVARLILPAMCASVTLADTYPRQKGIDVLHYTFGVTIHDESDAIEGEATIEVRFVEAAVPTLMLDLASQVSGKGMTVTGVSASGVPAKFEHKDDRLSITLDPRPNAGDKRTVRVAYHGIPREGLSISKNRYGERTFFSKNWPDKARHWLPAVDHPYDKATTEFVVNAPAHFQVVANGLLEEETDVGNGRRLTHWKQSVPIATWLNAIGVAHFTSHHAGAVKGIPLETWVYPKDHERVTANVEAIARRTLEFYIEHIGSYPYQKLASIEAAGVNGGMEHASAIFYGERNLTGPGVTGLVAHEIAHQWFGDSVTERDWDDVWLSEGFATYFTLLFLEHDSGRDAFMRGLDRSRTSVFNFEKNNPKLAVLHESLSDMKHVVNNLVYQKGGWALHMLRGILGDGVFWTGIRNYYQRYRDASASTTDFKREMEEASKKDLGWFFDQWLKRPGSPQLKGSWRFVPDQKQVDIELSQVQPGEPYRLPLELGIGNGGERLTYEKIELNARKGHFTIKASAVPRTITLDPNQWVLMKQEFSARAD
jgi:aminopeptidase N